VLRIGGAHDEDRTRLKLLDREVTSPDADVRNLLRTIPNEDQPDVRVTAP
jgi:hypothetical protein